MREGCGREPQDCDAWMQFFEDCWTLWPSIQFAQLGRLGSWSSALAHPKDCGRFSSSLTWFRWKIYSHYHLKSQRLFLFVKLSNMWCVFFANSATLLSIEVLHDPKLRELFHHIIHLDLTFEECLQRRTAQSPHNPNPLHPQDVVDLASKMQKTRGKHVIFWTKPKKLYRWQGCSRWSDVMLFYIPWIAGDCHFANDQKISDSQWVLSYHVANHTFLLFSYDLLGNLHIKESMNHPVEPMLQLRFGRRICAM